MRVVPYRQNDVSRVANRPIDYMGDDVDVLEITAASGITWTFLNGDEPVAVVSGMEMWDGVAHIWAVVSDKIRGKGIKFTKLCRQLLDDSAEAYGVRRYGCLIKINIEENIKWIKLLGFEYEYTMQKASPEGEDMIGFVKWCKGDNHE